jgi:hypothetical protein
MSENDILIKLNGKKTHIPTAHLARVFAEMAEKGEISHGNHRFDEVLSKNKKSIELAHVDSINLLSRNNKEVVYAPFPNCDSHVILLPDGLNVRVTRHGDPIKNMMFVSVDIKHVEQNAISMVYNQDIVN